MRAEAHHEAKPYLLTCTQMPGTAVFLPRGWGRATVSLGDTLSLSVREVGMGYGWELTCAAEQRAGRVT